MAADTLTTGAPCGDARGTTAPSCRALQPGAAPGAAFNTPGADDHSDVELLRRAAMPDGSGGLKVALGKWLNPFAQLESVFHLADLADALAYKTRVSPPPTSNLPVATTWRSAKLTADGPARSRGSSIGRRATFEARCMGAPGGAGPALSPGGMLRPAALAGAQAMRRLAEPA